MAISTIKFSEFVDAGNLGSSDVVVGLDTGVNARFNAITGDGLTWSADTTGTIAAAVENGYVCENAGVTTVTLPSTATLGSVIEVEGAGAGGWVLTAGIGQTIQIGTSVTSAGGTLTSAAPTDGISVVCIDENLVWRVRTTNSTGLTVA